MTLAGVNIVHSAPAINTCKLSTLMRVTNGEVSFVDRILHPEQSANIDVTDFGIFLAFCISNWALVYFFIYTVRVRGWNFGFGYVFGGLGKAVSAIKKPLGRQQKEQKGGDEE